MSVLIKGMEMPTRCAVCVLCDLRYGTKCKITKMSYYDSEGYPRGGYNDRPDWCPLVEIPEPHGDLINRDALLEMVKDVNTDYYCEVLGVTVEDIDSAPTVIEAEWSEDDERFD